MRTINEIKTEIGNAYIANETVRERYGIAKGETFDKAFSVVSIESIIFYCCAVGIWLLEQLFDTHKKEVRADLDARLPHTAQWYRNIVLNFEYNGDKPVKYCAVNEYDNKLQVKIASGEPSKRDVVPYKEVEALASWLMQYKDAGTKIILVNENRDKLDIAAEVYYDALYLRPEDGKVEEAITEYVSNLDFDGLLTFNNLTQAMLAVEGVKLVRINSCYVQYAEDEAEDLGVQRVSTSGYWNVRKANIKYKPYTTGNI